MNDARPETPWPAPLRVDLDSGALRDALGRDVQLRGVNLGGRSKWSPFLPFELSHPDASLDEVRQRAEALCQQVASWGLNAARVTWSWEALEPERDAFDHRYLARIGALLDAAQAHGLGVILDLHQDLFAAPLCGDGFPRWACPANTPLDLRPEWRGWFLGYALDERVIEAFDDLWRNRRGLLDALLHAWHLMLDALAHHPALLGVEALNEPGWGRTPLRRFATDILRPFYARFATLAHSHNPHLLIGFGAPGVEFLGMGDVSARPDTDQALYAPHLYDPALLLWPRSNLITTHPDRLLDALGRYQREAATPVLIGEFGYTYGAPAGPAWLTQVLDGLDAHRLHATIWECSHSEALWNGEDLNLVDAARAPREAARVYARPHLRAVSADDAKVRWSDDHLTMTATWTQRSRAPAHIALPALWPLRAIDCDAPHTHAQARLIVTPEPGAHVTLRLHRAPA